MARKLRIAASVFFGVLSAAVLLFWVRGYWCRDIFRGPRVGNSVLLVGTSDGQVIVALNKPWDLWPSSSRMITEPAHKAFIPTSTFAVFQGGFVVPHWFLALIFAVAAFAPWAGHFGFVRSPRFSLRTLLIATTLAAVGLGLAASAWR